MGTQKLWATNPGLPEVHIVSGGSRNEPENTVRGPAVSKGPRLGIGGARRDIGGAFPNIGGARAPPTIWKLASLLYGHVVQKLCDRTGGKLACMCCGFCESQTGVGSECYCRSETGKVVETSPFQTP